MKVIVGLGNPGKKYEGTRHNVGFLLVDRVADESPAPGSWKGRFKDSLTFDTEISGHKIILLKPLSYMNLSGIPVKECLDFLKLPPQNLIVVYDDVDLTLGCMRLRLGGGDGGHKGLRSIIENLGNSYFYRVRIGIGRPQTASAEENVADWVLKNFSSEEKQVLEETLARGVKAMEVLLAEGLERAQNLYNRGDAGL
ncbi:MAG: aminoacyl-tRNA hydrolase [Proteobacteria bacterium]|nr:MAG: aminoacyl-tRNA hydrolase [Pseudomonadota bacterium]